MARVSAIRKTAGYAFIAPRLRLLRLMSLETDLKALVTNIGDIRAFLQTLRSIKLAPYFPEKLELRDVEKAAWKFYIENIGWIKLYTPEEALPIIEFYEGIVLSMDLTTIGKASYERSFIKLEDLIAPENRSIEHVYRLSMERGFTGYIQALRDIGFKYAAKMLEEEASRKLIELSLDIDLLSKGARVLKESAKDGNAWRIVCGRVDIIAARVAANAVMLGLSDEERKLVANHLRACRLSTDQLRDIINIGDISSVVSILKETPYGTASGEHIDVITEQVTLIRRLNRNTIIRGLASNIFNPALLTAILELLLLDIEDLILVVTAAYAGLRKPTNYLSIPM